MSAMNEWKTKCVGLQRTGVSKRTVIVIKCLQFYYGQPIVASEKKRRLKQGRVLFRIYFQGTFILNGVGLLAHTFVNSLYGGSTLIKWLLQILAVLLIASHTIDGFVAVSLTFACHAFAIDHTTW